VIIDSVRAYFCSTSIMTFVERLVKHAEKLGKDGVTAIADMGAFFQFNNSKNKKASVMEYENSLPSKFYSKLKGFCCYDQKDFDRLTGLVINKQIIISYSMPEKDPLSGCLL
jgi:hypothetical protein